MRSWSQVLLPMAALFLLQLFQETDQFGDDLLQEDGPTEILTGLRDLGTTPPKANYSRCLGEWKYYPDTNSCYKLIFDTETYARQEEICEAIGGRMAVINSEKLIAFFTKSFPMRKTWTFVGAKVSGRGITWADGTFWNRAKLLNHLRIRFYMLTKDHRCLMVTADNWWDLTSCEKPLRAACEITDVDKCIQNNGDCEYTCQSIMGDKTCLCPPNYYLKNETSCDVENPCHISNGGCDHICKNPRRGESECRCKRGYNARPNGQCFYADDVKSMSSLYWTRALMVALILLTVTITTCRYCPKCRIIKCLKKTTSAASGSSSSQESAGDSSDSDESGYSMIRKNGVGQTEKAVKFEDKKMSVDSSENGSSDSTSSSSSGRSRKSARKSNIWSYTMRGFRKE